MAFVCSSFISLTGKWRNLWALPPMFPRIVLFESWWPWKGPEPGRLVVVYIQVRRSRPSFDNGVALTRWSSPDECRHSNRRQTEVQVRRRSVRWLVTWNIFHFAFSVCFKNLRQWSTWFRFDCYNWVVSALFLHFRSFMSYLIRFIAIIHESREYGRDNLKFTPLIFGFSLVLVKAV